ncbi:hypothetical protein LTR91_000779 [Friedmanniomyces endolithicus]|uniref:KOW domain-containing protein n=1 Tax=Friedmanniomyces endolithicus TaxID=329885 RepID=A0AAN6L1F6_9PEZI|nr:hypothetical protein LTR57_006057 [Friedmanniomyces endolithicus]KAK0963023.1 hypothetical protein LTS01_019530 [Friedmanniomyces endolithicus]KAK1014978.1 hypothetical protein LTR91_000779 [Friedmanniomyces endolithicus]KAK1031771.1 hypothetical protein LTS16_017787 [Friedmanniomyces endolithicus]
MQKVVQRTLRAERVTNRKKAKAREHLSKAEGWSNFHATNRLKRVTSANIRTARLARQEDWEAGALLAPRRDVGEQANTYGAIMMYNANVPELPARKQPKWLPFSEGDRLLVIKGRDKGRIGECIEVQKERGCVRIKGLNVMDVIVPEWMKAEDSSRDAIEGISRFLPLDSVQLVYPLPDPVTGIPRDVVIERLIHINHRFDKMKGEWTPGDRLIPDVPAFFVTPPMPVTVIDELRNKYSRFRTRHTWQYVEQKELEAAKVEKRKELVKGMRTPLQELAEVRRMKREAEGERELSEEQLARIGEVIASERGKAVGTVRGSAR